MKKIILLNFELGIPFNLIRKAMECLDKSMYSFEGAVRCYQNLFVTGRYLDVPESELLPVIQSIVFNCPDENDPFFQKLREKRKPYSRDVYVRPAA